MNRIVLVCTAAVGASLYFVYVLSTVLFVTHLDASKIDLIESVIIVTQVIRLAGIVAYFGAKPARIEVLLVILSFETFVVMGLGTVFNGLTNRRDPASGLDPPIFKAAVVSLFPVVMLVLATQLPSLQSGLLTQSLSGREWLACIGLALLLPVVVETNKWLHRRRLPQPSTLSVQRAVTGETVEHPGAAA